MRNSSGRVFYALLASGFICSAGCGAAHPKAASDAGPTFPPTPLQTVVSTSGKLHVAAFSSPQPPVTGTTPFQLLVTDAAGAPVTGLQLNVEPWMPVMRHGTSVVPTVTEKGDGIYEVSDVYFTMIGEWTLTTTVSGPMANSCGAATGAADCFTVETNVGVD